MSDVTKFVNDAGNGLKFYSFNPAAIYISSPDFILNAKNPYDCRKLPLNEFYKWIIEEFSKTGNFQYIQFFEDYTKIVDGYSEVYFKKCRKEDITPSRLLEGLTGLSEPLRDDVLYNVIVTGKVPQND
nr:hypothetical protein [Thermoclostridium stercorarium]